MKQKAWPTILSQSTNVMLETAGNERLAVQRSYLLTSEFLRPLTGSQILELQERK